MQLSSGKNTIHNLQAADNPKDVKGTNWGLFSIVIGLVSVVLSCLSMGFLGIVGIITGIVSLIKGEPKKGKAIMGIVCSAFALLISIGVLLAEPSDSSVDQEDKKEQVTAETTKEPEPAPEPTLSPEEKGKAIKEALQSGNKKDLEEYSQDEVSKKAEDIIKTLSFDRDKDYKIVNKVAKVMVSLYPEGKNTECYKYIISSYKEYKDINKKISSGEYKGIEEKWDEMSEAESQIISYTFHVNYDVWTNSQESALDKIINALTQEEEEYKHAYYANGCIYDYTLDFWSTNDEQEYIIYSHEAFPKSGNYSLRLIPTGELMHLTSTGGFERDVLTYTMVSEEDEEEYSRIEELKNDYEGLYYEAEYYKEAIRTECQSFLESSMEKDKKDETVSNNNKEYICPKSDVKKLSLKDVKKLSKKDRRLAKNEIFARYGILVL